MSMNIHIEATREVTVNKTGKASKQKIQFDCWQTPTNVSYSIIKSDNPVEAYKQWVIDCDSVEKYDIYDENDFFNELEPIGEEIVNYSEIHATELDEWVKSATDQGYEIEVFVM